MWKKWKHKSRKYNKKVKKQKLKRISLVYTDTRANGGEIAVAKPGAMNISSPQIAGYHAVGSCVEIV